MQLFATKEFPPHVISLMCLTKWWTPPHPRSRTTETFQDAPIILNPVTCYQWTCLPAQCSKQVFLWSIPQLSLSFVATVLIFNPCCCVSLMQCQWLYGLANHHILFYSCFTQFHNFLDLGRQNGTSSFRKNKSNSLLRIYLAQYTVYSIVISFNTIFTYLPNQTVKDLHNPDNICRPSPGLSAITEVKCFKRLNYIIKEREGNRLS